MNGLMSVGHEAQLLGTEPGELVLCIRGGAQDGQSVRVGERKCTIGSAERSTIRVKSATAAPVECLVLRGAHRTIIRRWQGAPLLNGQAFSEAVLEKGDRLTFGSVTLEALRAPSFDVRNPQSEESHADESRVETSIVPPAPRVTPVARIRDISRTAARLRDLRSLLSQKRDENSRLAHEAALLASQLFEVQSARDLRAEAMTKRELDLLRRNDELTAREQTCAEADARNAQSLDAIKREQAAFDEKVLEIETNFSRERIHLQAEWLRLQDERNKFEDNCQVRCNAIEAERDAIEQERELVATRRREIESLQAEPQAIVHNDARELAALAECEARTLALAEAEAAIQARERAFNTELTAAQSRLAEREAALNELAATLNGRENAWRAENVEQQQRFETEAGRFEEARSRLEKDRAAQDDARAALEADKAAVEAERTRINEEVARTTEARTRLDEERADLERYAASLMEQRNEPVADIQPSPAILDPEQELRRQRIVEEESRWMSNLRHVEPEEPSELTSEVEEEIASAEMETLESDQAASQPEAVDAETRVEEESLSEAPASPVSAAELLKKFGFSLDDEPEQEAPEETQPEPIARHEEPKPAPIARSEEPKPEPAHDHEKEDSIDDYMAQLLARVGGKSTAPGSSTGSYETRDAASHAVKREAAKPVAKEPEAAPELLTDPSEMFQRARAPESKSELSVMREIANLNARLAIDKSFRSKMKSTTTSKLLVMLCSLVCGLGLLIWWTQGQQMAFIPAIISLGITFVWGLQYAFLARRLAASRALEEEARGER